MKNPFLKLRNPLLRKISKEIPTSKMSSTEVKGIIQKMLTIAKGERGDKKRPIMVGLAAPQIGIPQRIILVDIDANGKRKIGKIKVYLNPEIIWKSKKEIEWAEGCYSTGKICGIVKRSASVKIKAYAEDGKQKLEKHTDFTARIFQHEIDHLNGKVFIHLVKDPKKLHLVSKKDFPKYRRNQAWRNWDKLYPLPLASKLQKQV